MWKVSGILTPEQESAGFAVMEEEDFVYLMESDEFVLVFLAESVTTELLRSAAAARLATSNR